jgi:Ca-activated chloride channel family protein
MHDNTKEKMIVYLAGGFIFVAAVFPGPACAASKRKAVSEGNALYQQGAYTDSAEKYRAALENDPESDIINFNLGTAIYKGEDYAGAVSRLRKTLLSDDAELREKGFYNLGNALYRLGLTKEKDDLIAAISSLEEALKQYEGALSLQKNDVDAQYNYEFVKKELERLRQQQQQQRQDQEKSGEGQKKDQKGQQKSQEKSSQDAQQQQDSQSQGPSAEDQQTEESSGAPKAQEEDQPRPSEPKPSQGQPPADARELTPKEARTLLESYQQNEEPQGLLDMSPRKRDAAPVLKDW